MRKLTDYRNFWLIWLGCAGDTDGTSLFSIQKEWCITTNYLYHREAGLNKPLCTAMIEGKFIEKKGRKLIAKFDWIPDYVIERQRPRGSKGWSLKMFTIENWAKVQDFIETYHEAIFDTKVLKTLYPDLKSIQRKGQDIFDDVFTLILVSNILPFCSKYKAHTVTRIIYTILSVTPERDLLGYFLKIMPEVSRMGEFPRVITDENELMGMLYPLKEE